MIYAPQSKEEVQTVMEIIKAGVGWISGEKFVPVPEEEGRDLPFAATEQLPCPDEKAMDHRCGAVAS